MEGGIQTEELVRNLKSYSDLRIVLIFISELQLQIQLLKLLTHALLICVGETWFGMVG